MQGLVVLDLVSLIQNAIPPYKCLLKPRRLSGEDLIRRDHDIEVCCVSLRIGAGLDERTLSSRAMKADDSEAGRPLSCFIRPGLQHTEWTDNEVWPRDAGCCGVILLKILETVFAL